LLVLNADAVVVPDLKIAGGGELDHFYRLFLLIQIIVISDPTHRNNVIHSLPLVT